MWNICHHWLIQVVIVWLHGALIEHRNINWLVNMKVNIKSDRKVMQQNTINSTPLISVYMCHSEYLKKWHTHTHTLQKWQNLIFPKIPYRHIKNSSVHDLKVEQHILRLSIYIFVFLLYYYSNSQGFSVKISHQFIPPRNKSQTEAVKCLSHLDTSTLSELWCCC